MVELAAFWTAVLVVAAVLTHLRDELEHYDRGTSSDELEHHSDRS